MSSVLNDDIEYDELYDGFIKKLKDEYHIAIEQSDIHWRGFWSQGDGLCFDFNISDYDIVQFLLKIDAPLAKDFEKLDANNIIYGITLNTTKNSFAINYYHSRTRFLEFTYHNYMGTPLDDVLEKVRNNTSIIREHIYEWYLQTCDEFYKELESHYNENAELEEDRKEWDDETTISDRIDAMIDPEMNIEKVVEMITDARVLSVSQQQSNELIENFIKNFNNEYLIIKKDNK